MNRSDPQGESAWDFARRNLMQSKINHLESSLGQKNVEHFKWESASASFSRCSTASTAASSCDPSSNGEGSAASEETPPPPGLAARTSLVATELPIRGTSLGQQQWVEYGEQQQQVANTAVQPPSWETCFPRTAGAAVAQRQNDFEGFQRDFARRDGFFQDRGGGVFSPQGAATAESLSPAKVGLSSLVNTPPRPTVYRGPRMVKVALPANERKAGSDDFMVPEHWRLLKVLGKGAYGTVASFEDTCSGERMAVKQICNAFSDLSDGMRTLREIMVLRSVQHKHIVQMRYLLPPKAQDFDDVYLVQELLDTNLEQIIRSKQKLSEFHHRYMAHGILSGLCHLHEMDVVHRDLKPANILVNADCTVKICDLNLARSSRPLRPARCKRGDQYPKQGGMTEYICTRWYRAPEVVLLRGAYGTPMDIWAVGCILCEFVLRKPLFAGTNSHDQLRKIAAVLGAPPAEAVFWPYLASGADRFLRSLVGKQGQCWQTLLPGASPTCVRAVEQMLTWDPQTRSTARECLRFTFFEDVVDPAPRPFPSTTMDWSFDVAEPTREILQKHVYDAAAADHPWILARDSMDNADDRHGCSITEDVRIGAPALAGA
jgi:mitogen-activated protein kinase 1/3